MFITLPKGIKSSDEILDKILLYIPAIDRRLLVEDKHQDVIKVVIDSVNRLIVTVYDGVIIISSGKIMRKFYSFDYDSWDEWVYDASTYLSHLFNATVRTVFYYNKHKKCLKQEIYRMENDQWRLIIAIPKTLNLFAAKSKKLQAVSNVVTFTQQ